MSVQYSERLSTNTVSRRNSWSLPVLKANSISKSTFIKSIAMFPNKNSREPGRSTSFMSHVDTFL